MNEFGKVYMSTVGCGIVYGELAGTPHSTTTKTTTTTTKAATTTTTSAVTTGSGSTTGAKATLIGDANLDKKVTVADAVAILQSIANKDKFALDKEAAANADCFDPGDGITAKDALAIQQLDAKAIDSLPAYSTK